MRLKGGFTYLVSLADCDQHDLSVVGGKAYQLGRLSAAGWPVPEGFCLTTSAWHSWQETTELGDLIKKCVVELTANPVQTGVVLQRLRSAVLETPLPAWLLHRIELAGAELLSKGPVIVRSSAPNEDASTKSNAGIYESFPGQGSIEQIVAAIRAVWASLFTERALFYNSGKLFTDMAVIIQLEIKPDCAGVMFTAHPLTGRKELIIQWDKFDTSAVTSGRSQSQVICLSNTIDSTDATDINSLLIAALKDAATGIEHLLSSPVDIEWAWVRNELYILQARQMSSNIATKQLVSTWVCEEDLSEIYQLELGKCQARIIKELRKKLWFRLFCREKGIATFRTLFVVYSKTSLPHLSVEMSKQFDIPYLRVSWGEHSEFTHISHLSETLAQGMQHNRLTDPIYAAAEVSEIIPSDLIGFSTVLTDGAVLMEIYPGGIKGTKSGVQPATRCRYDINGLAMLAQPTYSCKAVFHSDAMKWEQVDCPPYSIDPDPKVTYEIADITRQFSTSFGEVRLEWYVYQQRVYIKDLSVEAQAILDTVPSGVVAPGRASGYAICLSDVSAYESLADRFSISVKHIDDAVFNEDTLTHFQAISTKKPLIVVAQYPSLGLAPLTRYARGFVFEHCPLLSHMSIILREQGIPAIIVPNARELIHTDDIIDIGPDGLTISPRAASSIQS